MTRKYNVQGAYENWEGGSRVNFLTGKTCSNQRKWQLKRSTEYKTPGILPNMEITCLGKNCCDSRLKSYY